MTDPTPDDDLLRRADRWLASSVSGPPPAGLVMDLRNEVARQGLEAPMSDTDDLRKILDCAMPPKAAGWDLVRAHIEALEAELRAPAPMLRFKGDPR